MNIDTSRLTYNPMAQPSQAAQNRQAQKAADEANRIQTEQPAPSPPPKEAQTKSPLSAQNIQWDAPLSKYLSQEEKVMLDKMFPPSGRNVGIRAYAQDHQPVRNRMEVGKRIDLTT